MEGKILQNTKEIFSDGVQVSGAFSKRGELFVADWKQAAILEGRGFCAKVGALSTPVVGGGNGTVVDLDQPEFGMIIPAGTCVIPLRLAVQLSTPLLATDADEVEALAYVDVTAATVAAALDGTWANTITPTNMRIALANILSSACTVKSVCSADTTDPTESMDLAHIQITGDVQGTPATALWTAPALLYEPVVPPVLVGPCSLFVHWGGTVAVNGFMQFFWIEIPSTQIV